MQRSRWYLTVTPNDVDSNGADSLTLLLIRRFDELGIKNDSLNAAWRVQWRRIIPSLRASRVEAQKKKRQMVQKRTQDNEGAERSNRNDRSRKFRRSDRVSRGKPRN